LNDLFDRSVIGNKYSNNDFKFKYREPIDGSEIYRLDKSENIVMHYGFKVYFNNLKRS